jgi:hypothetical protein
MTVARRRPETDHEHYRRGPVIAERILTFHRRGRGVREVRVRLGRPRPWPKSLNSDWMCTYQVLGLGDDRVKRAIGVDGLQALLLAAHVLPAEVAARAKNEGGACRWTPDLWSDDGARMAAKYSLPLSKRRHIGRRSRRTASTLVKPQNNKMQRTSRG